MTKHFCDLCGKEIPENERICTIEAFVWTNEEHIEQRNVNLDCCILCTVVYNFALHDFQSNYIEKRQQEAKM